LRPRTYVQTASVRLGRYFLACYQSDALNVAPILLPILSRNYPHCKMQLSGPVNDGKQYDDQDAQLVLDRGTPRYALPLTVIILPVHKACIYGQKIPCRSRKAYAHQRLMTIQRCFDGTQTWFLSHAVQSAHVVGVKRLGFSLTQSSCLLLPSSCAMRNSPPKRLHDENFPCMESCKALAICHATR